MKQDIRELMKYGVQYFVDGISEQKAQYIFNREKNIEINKQIKLIDKYIKDENIEIYTVYVRDDKLGVHIICPSIFGDFKDNPYQIDIFKYVIKVWPIDIEGSKTASMTIEIPMPYDRIKVKR